MKKTILLITIGSLIMIGCKEKKWTYPEIKKQDVVDVYFGDTVADPYRWLENDTAADVKEWVGMENAITDEYIAKIPFKADLEKRLTQIWDYPKYGTPIKKGGRYFFMKNDGLQNQYVLYVQDELNGEPSVLLDPNSFSTDGTVALSGFFFSKEGDYIAYSVSKGGSDWNEIYVMDVANKQKMEDHLEWVKFSEIAWFGNGFFYSRYDKPQAGTELSGKNEYHKVYYHKLGEPQAKDILIYKDEKHPLRTITTMTDDDEQYLFLMASDGTSTNALYMRKNDDPKAAFQTIYGNFDYEFSPVDVVDGKILIMTNYQAPGYKLIAVDPLNIKEEAWEVLIPEKESVLQNVDLINGKIIATYLQDAKSVAYVYDTKGNLQHEVTFPTIGSVAGFSGDKDDSEAFYSFSSYINPPTIYKYNVENNTSEIFRKAEIDFNSDDFETTQVFFESKDGTKVPMFMTHKKGVVLDGNNPVLLYGYGGFNIPMTPSFSLSNLPFIENGGIYVVVNLRGGGEYGTEWHEAGTKMSKQNVFDDFISAAEWLIANKYTNPEKLAVMGGSNGGLLVGAVMTQRPELFKVALPSVGVLDMLRYHNFTIGWAWAGDYGTSEESKEMYEYLKGYSPLHNLKEGVNYPATLVYTADHDDRVVPAHSFKFIATLQEKNGGENPVLIRIASDAGHGAGKPTSKTIEETAERWAFTMYNLGMKPKK